MFVGKHRTSEVARNGHHGGFISLARDSTFASPTFIIFKTADMISYKDFKHALRPSA